MILQRVAIVPGFCFQRAPALFTGQVETDEVPDGTVLKEFTKGYKSASRTIRPARVKVAKHPQKIELSAEEAIAEEPITQK